VAAGDVTGDGKAEVIAGTASTTGAVKVFQFSSNTYTQIGSTMKPFPSVAAGVQVAAVDIDGDGTSEIAIAVLTGGDVKVQIFNSAGVQQGTEFTAASGVKAFAVGHIDLDQDGTSELVVGIRPPDVNQFEIFNATTGAEIGGFDPFATLTGGLAVDGI
jgi:hypothetical protein